MNTATCNTSLCSRVLLAAIVCLTLGCSGGGQSIGASLESSDGVRYTWSAAGGAGSRQLVAIRTETGATGILDEGVFANVLGPVLTPGGVAWAVLEDGSWSVHQTGVSEIIPKRSQGASDALAAAWHLERVGHGHAPGDAADLAQIATIASSGEWPKP